MPDRSSFWTVVGTRVVWGQFRGEGENRKCRGCFQVSRVRDGGRGRPLEAAGGQRGGLCEVGGVRAHSDAHLVMGRNPKREGTEGPSNEETPAG